jgi:ATP-dependent HslUV protease, peptidase subunit HslV
MSIAVAVSKGTSLAIAADTQENFGDRKLHRDNHRAAKIMQIGGTYLATTGWGLYDNILEDYLARVATPRLGNRRAVFSFFMRLWKDLSRRYSLVNDQPHQEEPSPFADLDAMFLVVGPGGIFHVAGNLSVTQFRQYYAIGSGASYALGALHALYGEDLTAEDLARRACAAAMEFDISCGGEMDSYHLRSRNVPAAAKSRRRS